MCHLTLKGGRLNRALLGGRYCHEVAPFFCDILVSTKLVVRVGGLGF